MRAKRMLLSGAENIRSQGKFISNCIILVLLRFQNECLQYYFLMINLILINCFTTNFWFTTPRLLFFGNLTLFINFTLALFPCGVKSRILVIFMVTWESSPHLRPRIDCNKHTNKNIFISCIFGLHVTIPKEKLSWCLVRNFKTN